MINVDSFKHIEVEGSVIVLQFLSESIDEKSKLDKILLQYRRLGCSALRKLIELRYGVIERVEYGDS